MLTSSRNCTRLSPKCGLSISVPLSGYVLDDPIPEATSFAVANGGVEGFVRAAALSLPRGVRINAISPRLTADSYEQFGRFNPGRAPRPYEHDRLGLRTQRRGMADRRDHPGTVTTSPADRWPAGDAPPTRR